MSTFSLVQHFDQYFEALPVRDDGLRREVFKLRFAVYCEELAYEDRSAFPDGEEHDDFDGDSAFALLRHRATGRAAGCVRLIVNANSPTLRFPFEKVCADHLDPKLLDPATLDRSRAGEISRLAVHQDFRRRVGESKSAEGASDDAASHFGGARRHPLVAMGLFLSASALALERGLDQVLVMMEPRLARLLGSCGIHFTQVGDVVDYHGKRGPFRITRSELLGNLQPESRQLLEHLMRALR
jgi:N-acyl amino acid synthase of PEP-CTERM/exosortase system